MTKTVTTGKATDLITFTRSTTGTYLDSVKYGDELVTNGDFSNGTANWSSASDGVGNVVDGQLVITSSNPSDTAYAMSQSFTVVQGKSYKVSANLVSTTGSNLQCRAGSTNTSATYGTLDSNNSFGNVSMIVVPTTNTMWITLYGFGAGDSATFDNVSVKELIGNQGASGEPLLRTANTNEPRIEYDSDGNLKGLLIEEQRTNLHPKSGELTNWTYSNNLFKYEDVTTAPDGTNTADSLVPTTELSSHFTGLPQSISTGSGSETFSVFVKANGYSKIKLYLANQSGNNNQLFDISEGTLGTSGSDLLNKSIESMGNGWYRCSITYTSTKTIPYPSVALLADNYSNTSAGDGVKGIYIWGAQIESGSFPTSYIPTSGSTVTRNADVATINVSEFEYNTTEGSISMEIVPPSNNSGEQQWILGSNTNSARWAYTNAGFDRAIAYDGVNTFGGEDLQPSTINKIATGTDQSTAVIYVNGESLDGSQATNGNIASLTTIFYLGGNFSTGNVNLGGHIKSIKYYPVRLTDNQLKALTQ